MKYHADRQAAHITLDPFLFSPVDLIHVVAAITIVGAIIVEFDDKRRAEVYFNEVDEAAWRAAKEAFPSLPMSQRLSLMSTFTSRQETVGKSRSMRGYRGYESARCRDRLLG